MTDFLTGLLWMSVMGSLLAGALLLFRRVLKKETVHTVFYYMWLLVLLRLCVPFGVTVSVPVGNVAVPKQEAVPQKETGRTNAAGKDLAQGELQGEGAGMPADPKADLPAAAEKPVSAVLPEETRHMPDILFAPIFWMLVWGTGVLVCLRHYIFGYVRFAGVVRKHASEVSPAARSVMRELDKNGRVLLVECPFVNTPMLLGVFRPVIVLPTGIEDARRLRDILRHELIHAHRHDLLYKWFAVVVTSLHWFNPVMILVRREIGRACELACDEAVMRGMDAGERRHYGETLLALAAAPAGLGLLATTLCEEKKQLKERLVSIASYRRKGAAALIVWLQCAVTLGCGAMISGAELTGNVPGAETGSGRSRADAAGEASDTARPGADAAGAVPDADRSGTDAAGNVSDTDISGADAAGKTSDTDRSRADAAGKASDTGITGTAVLLREVLLGEKPFLCMNKNGGPTSMNIDDVAGFFSPDSAYAKIWQFVVLDLDGDGGEEAVVRVIDAAGDMGGCMVFHCEEGEVYGIAESYRAFESLKTDGTYDAYDIEYGDAVSRMRFAGGTCTSEWVIHCLDPSKGTSEGYPEFEYFVGGAPATQAEWSAAIDVQQKKQDAEWYYFTDEMIRAQLPAENDSDVDDENGVNRTAASKTSDTEGSENHAVTLDDIRDMYRFPVRVSEARVLTVALETSEPEKDYFSVDRILVFDGGTHIQTIETAKLTPSEEYLWEGLFVNKGHKEGEPDVRDVTFDGAEDFGLLTAASYPKNLPFMYFYWNEAENRFVQGFSVFGGEALQVDTENRCLVEHWYDVDGEHTTRYA